MAYPTADATEREQVEWVFGLTGGELQDRPMRYAFKVHSERYERAIGCENRGRWVPRVSIERGWFRYTYDGPPEYAAHELSDHYDRDHFTAVYYTGAHGDGQPPRVIATANGKVYRLVATYNSGGEVECPGRTLHECYGHEEHPTVTEDGSTVSLVTRHEAKLGPSWRESHDTRPGWWKGRRAECPLCGERVGSPHGHIYLGEGWVEAVYREFRFQSEG